MRFYKLFTYTVSVFTTHPRWARRSPPLHVWRSWGQRDEVTCSGEITLWTQIVWLQDLWHSVGVAFKSQAQSTEWSNWPESDTKTETRCFLLVTGLLEAELTTFYKVWGYFQIPKKPVPRRDGNLFCVLPVGEAGEVEVQKHVDFSEW